ncbi:hypothetical protein IQ266_20255 [filamentous cyanobacterium LEGE 11480]|uniref:Uncharacterized protein n=1 Tax=Romeriopsis navalis LEGE 11480 TaxID=2777977 RepID=A0A928Z6B5_9CYAN|nr:hypothetical protein [Romeriopsis navalis]MBE9032075.1 hypothetical protein [Romeriopsis navalis LEGE 11480]
MTSRLPATAPVLMSTIEGLNYRVTVGDVASQAGLELNLTQQGLMTLASESGGDLQVADSGEIVYVFAPDFRHVLRNKFLRLRLQEVWRKIWRVLFYIIRISFGIILIGLIVAAIVAIIALALAAQASRGEDNDSDWGNIGWGGGSLGYWWHPNIFWLFDWNTGYGHRRRYRQPERPGETPQLNFLESIFSFLFGDGNPNADLDDRRWQSIGSIIRNHQGAIIAEQVTPFLDQTDTLLANESSILPVLLRFNGQPEVSPDGEIIYHFPQLQSTAESKRKKYVANYLEEKPWQFTQATTGQVTIAIILGIVLLVLGVMLQGMLATAGAVSGLIQAIALLALVYGIIYLAIPAGRYFWLQRQNQQIAARNQQRQDQAAQLDRVSPEIQHKLDFAKQFAAETIIRKQDLIYTTEEDLMPQELKQAGADWEKQLQDRHPEAP